MYPNSLHVVSRSFNKQKKKNFGSDKNYKMLSEKAVTFSSTLSCLIHLNMDFTNKCPYRGSTGKLKKKVGRGDNTAGFLLTSLLGMIMSIYSNDSSDFVM